MDFTTSPTVGFDWGHAPLDQMPTPIPHDPMDFNLAPGTGSMQFAGPSNARRNSDISDRETLMDDEAISESQQRHRTVSSRRNRHGNEDWDAKKETLYRLYIEEGRILTETIAIMKKSHGFHPSAKAYKEKFKAWGWRRNLPGEVALWMVERAKDRADTGKKTEFEFGGKRWTLEQAATSATRSKKALLDEVKTPEGVVVKTPSSNLNMDGQIQVEHASDVEEADDSAVVFVGERQRTGKVALPLNFNGRSASDLASLLVSARNYAQSGDAQSAENAYLLTLEGFQHVLGEVHDTAIKVGLELATFYTEQDRKQEADEILEKLTSAHIHLLGFDDRKTRQHVLHVAELLNSWRRQEDALIFLTHARDLARNLDQSGDHGSVDERKSKARGKARSKPPFMTGQEALQQTINDIVDGPSVNNINHGLDDARLHAASNEPAVPVLLTAIEYQCVSEPAKFGIQRLRARTELLKYYLKTAGGVNLANKDAFLTAKDILSSYWSSVHFEPNSFKSQEAVEASLELTAATLKGCFDVYARDMFRVVEAAMVRMLGSHDERTIWMFISIGIIYQSYRTWDVARPWFERAWAAADARWGSSDGITRSLSSALFDKRHFSYINDEGRPFETIFGVCGLTIRPTRLHIE